MGCTVSIAAVAIVYPPTSIGSFAEPARHDKRALSKCHAILSHRTRCPRQPASAGSRSPGGTSIVRGHTAWRSSQGGRLIEVNGFARERAFVANVLRAIVRAGRPPND